MTRAEAEPAAAGDLGPPGASIAVELDIGPPTAVIRVEILPAGGGLYHAKLVGGYLLAERTARPFAAACTRLLELGIDPQRAASMTIGSVVVRSATLGAAAAEGSGG
jgi:hypothetical protein